MYPAYTFDATTFKSFIGVNGQVPGPTLIVWENQTVVAIVSNELQLEAVSIHWHGMTQFNTYFMDGVHHITQCQLIHRGLSATYSRPVHLALTCITLTLESNAQTACLEH